jgi:hypothetical protein
MDPKKQIPEGGGTFKLPKDGGDPVRVAPIPGVEEAQAKLDEGAKLGELDDLEQGKILKKKYREEEARILAEVAREKGPPKPVIDKNYGVLGDMSTMFELVHEQVGPFNRTVNKFVTWKDMAQFATTGSYKKGYDSDYSKPDIAATKEVVDRLLHLKAIRPLIAMR